MQQLILYLTLFLLCSTLSWAGALPDSLKFDWIYAAQSCNIDYTHYYNASECGVLPDGSDQYVNLQNLINQVLVPAEIYIPAGEYLFNSSIKMRDSIMISGDGESTVLNFQFGDKAISCFNISGAAGQTDALGHDVDKSTNSIKVAGHHVSIGDFIEIRQDNGDWDSNPASWAVQSVGQILRVTDIDGDIITFEPSLNINYSEDLAPEIQIIYPARHIGFRCFTVRRLDQPAEGAGYNFNFSRAADCFVCGVESDKSVGSHIMINLSTHIQVTGCYIHHGFTYDGSGTRGYGVTLNNHSSSCLIDNNIFEHLRHAMMTKHGANGNVIAYNYSHSVYRSEPLLSDYSGDISLHGHYSYANLFEGNVVNQIYIDGYWGPSGPGNTFLRNRLTNYGIINSSDDTDNQNFVANDVLEQNLLKGYQVGGSGHFEYANRIKGALINPEDTGPGNSSYYLETKPDFWLQAQLWPGIGIGSEGQEYYNPAYYRFHNSGRLTDCSGYSSVPDIYIQQDDKALANWNAGQLIIELPETMDNNIRAVIYDLSGQLVSFDVRPERIDNTMFTMPFKLSNGIYLIKIVAGDKSYVAKFSVRS